eukprot:g6957.t1
MNTALKCRSYHLRRQTRLRRRPLTVRRPIPRAVRLSVKMSSKPSLSRNRPVPRPAVAVGEKLELQRGNKFQTPRDSDVLAEDVIEKLEFFCGGHRNELSEKAAYNGASWSVREYLLDRLRRTMDVWKEHDPKSINYLSAEFLMGRSLWNAIHNLELENPYSEAVKTLGADLETVSDQERDASLGNGGLGRLAACFLDAMATLNLPGWGYGIRYKYGMFKQVLEEGKYQHEVPDIWLTNNNPWDIKRPDVRYVVKFADQHVMAVAYDMPIPGFRTSNVANLRLWDCEALSEFDLESFNDGKFYEAYDEKEHAEAITSVLYPNDSTNEGKLLRLKQQYFFVSASLQDVLARFKSRHGSNWDLLPEKECFQLNDTHPTIGVAELMRLLVDEEGLSWMKAWNLTTNVFAFTNHTVMPEALEKWNVTVVEELLPRVYEIITQIDNEWTDHLEERFTTLSKGAKAKKIQALSIIHQNPWNEKEMLINMAHLAVVGSFAVNGVAAIHSEIIKDTIFKDFFDIWPDKFQNKTNGVTPRRWLAFCNPDLSELITSTLGNDNWKTSLGHLESLRDKAEDAEFRKKWKAVKQKNKARLAAKIKEATGDTVNTEALFDIQIKRIHEYKRQHLNIMSIIWRYLQIKSMSAADRSKVVPRVCVFGGKAASAYDAAKRMIRLVTAVGEKINNDPEVGDLLKVYFIPDYNVTLAETLIPAADLSQHISTAGTEASGTSNMKFQMNGSLIIGTMDGANIEIAEEVARLTDRKAKVGTNMFVFGVDAEDVPRLREERKDFITDERWDKIIEAIREGEFGDAKFFKPLMDNIDDMTIGNDWFLLANDFASYLEAQEEVDNVWRDQDEWIKRSIIYTASSGKFSSDRTISQYAEEIWDVKPLKIAD